MKCPRAVPPWHPCWTRVRYGGILADEPGLSKTLQLIAVLEALLSAGLVCSVLIVTPSNVL